MVYRSTPLENGYSPSELLFGRKMGTTVPVLPSNLLPCWPQMSQFRQKDNDSRKSKSTTSTNITESSSYLTYNKVKPVWIPDCEENGEIVDKHMTPWSYVMKTPTTTVSKSQTSYSIVITSQGKQCKGGTNTTSPTNPKASSVK